MIITDSIFVKNELIETFGIENTRIKNIPLGAEELFKPLESQETFEVLNILGLMHQNYILAVGTLEPRKNLQVAIFAYMRLPVRIRKKFPLVVVGMKGWHTSALEKQMAGNGFLMSAARSCPERSLHASIESPLAMIACSSSCAHHSSQ